MNNYKFILFFILMFISCKNEVEKKIIGNYKIYGYKKRDSNAVTTFILKIKSNGAFEYSCPNTMKGKWRAGDDEISMWVEFLIGTESTKGQVDWGNAEFIYISPAASSFFNCGNIHFDSLVFRKTN